MRYLKAFSVTAIFLLATQITFAQLGVAPNSGLGLGEIMDKGNVRNIGMGGIGLSNGSPFYSNVMNPALLVHNSFVVFGANYIGERKTVQIGDQSITDMGANLLHINFAFPVIKGKYTTALGLRPYSLVNYKFAKENLVGGTDQFSRVEEKGSGGVSQAYWAHGVKLAKGVSVGMELVYNFGAIKDERITSLIGADDIPLRTLDFVGRTNFANFSFTPGIVLSHKLDSATFLNFGFTYEKRINASIDYTLEKERLTDAGSPVDVDSLSVSTEKITIPESFNFGISLEKTLKYTVGVDFSWQKWGDYTNSINPDKLSDAWRLSVGGEFTPDATSVSSYLKRITYRTGLRYYNTPWLESNNAVNDVQIRDIGINFGLSLPVARGYSSLNIAFTVGERGNEAEGILNERYYRVGLGVNINDPQWFRRRKFN
jgi:hypothetical protein